MALDNHQALISAYKDTSELAGSGDAVGLKNLGSITAIAWHWQTKTKKLH